MICKMECFTCKEGLNSPALYLGKKGYISEFYNGRISEEWLDNRYSLLVPKEA